MWTRRDLKRRARRALHRNYWAVVALCFLLAFVGAEYTDSAELIHRNDDAQSNYDLVIDRLTPPEGETSIPTGASLARWAQSAEQMVTSLFNSLTSGHGWLFRVLAGGLFILAGLVLLLFGFLVSNPLKVAVRRFLLVNRTAPASPLETLAVFHRRPYARAVWLMFLRWLFLCLWTLLFVVPGMVKAYEYRMVPFLLASNPDLDRRRVFALSRIMMRGSKWRSFVLDVSFFLWNFLSALTLGLAGIFYVNPYIACTEAELYADLRQKLLEDGVAAPGELPL